MTMYLADHSCLNPAAVRNSKKLSWSLRAFVRTFVYDSTASIVACDACLIHSKDAQTLCECMRSALELNLKVKSTS